MTTIFSGSPAPVSGLYTDDHGHRVVLRPGEPAPLCTFTGATPIRWRLLRPLPMPRRGS